MTDDEDEEEVDDLDALAKGMEKGPTSSTGKPPSAAETSMPLFTPPCTLAGQQAPRQTALYPMSAKRCRVNTKQHHLQHMACNQCFHHCASAKQLDLKLLIIHLALHPAFMTQLHCHSPACTLAVSDTYLSPVCCVGKRRSPTPTSAAGKVSTKRKADGDAVPAAKRQRSVTPMAQVCASAMPRTDAA